MKLSTIAKEAAALAEASREHLERELPKRHPKYPLVQEGEEDSMPRPPEEQQLESLLSSLPEDAVYTLFLIAQQGRGYFNPQSLSERYAAVRADYPDRAEVVGTMLVWLYLDDYLRDGLEELSREGINIDALAPVKASA